MKSPALKPKIKYLLQTLEMASSPALEEDAGKTLEDDRKLALEDATDPPVGDIPDFALEDVHEPTFGDTSNPSLGDVPNSALIPGLFAIFKVEDPRLEDNSLLPEKVHPLVTSFEE